MENRLNKQENNARNYALWAIGSMVIIWTVLGVLSFTPREGYDRPLTREVTFEGQTALKGKQVFQAYNCMDCHTIVGNGAYFAPDLTNIHKDTGPAWLLAYLGSPGTYPPKAVVNIQLNELIQSGAIEGIRDLDEYFEKYPKAKERVEERGGIEALMPNLQFSKEEMDALVAFFDYTQRLNTAGWPPEVKARPSIIQKVKHELEEKSGIIRNIPMRASLDGADSTSMVTSGLAISESLGCIACHSTDGSTRIGPSWKGIYNKDVKLTDGRTVLVDDDYLRRAILQPNDDVVQGYHVGVMPSYEGTASEEDIIGIIEYIKSIK